MGLGDGPKSLVRKCRVKISTKDESPPTPNQTPSAEDNEGRDESKIKWEKDLGPTVGEEQKSLGREDDNFVVEEDLDCFDNDHDLIKYIEGKCSESKEGAKEVELVPEEKNDKRSSNSDEEWF